MWVKKVQEKEDYKKRRGKSEREHINRRKAPEESATKCCKIANKKLHGSAECQKKTELQAALGMTYHYLFPS